MQHGDTQTGRRDAYATAGVDTAGAAGALSGLIEALRAIDTGGPRRAVVGPGHYASVLALDERTGIAIGTDGVGTKLIVAEQMRRFDTVGIDCVAMNVNDLICVGAEPLAMVDYIAVERADPAVLAQIGAGLRRGAEIAGIEIPGGELAQVPEMVRGHPSPGGLDLVGTAIGTVALDRMVTGERIEPGDVILGLPASGVHSNGLTLARRALLQQGGLALDDHPPQLARSVGEELLEPTAIYVRPVLELLASDADVRGLAHITGDGMLNLRRLNENVGFRLDEPLPAPPVFELIRSAGGLSSAEMHEVFNMGTGFCCIVPAGGDDAALDVLRRHHASARRVGSVVSDPGTVSVPGAGIAARPGRGFEAA